MTQIRGKQSLQFDRAVHIIGSASVVGQREGEGPLGKLFDRIEVDPMLGKNTWEEAESALQQKALEIALEKAGVSKDQMRYLFSGDLLGQLIATSFGLMDFEIPLIGLYGACSTIGLGLSLGAMAVNAGYADYVGALTSSHFGSAEKQFRFPLEYANQRALSATWTVTGSGAFILAQDGGKARISGTTTGKMLDFGIRDAQNMGASMAPAACDTIYQNLVDFERKPEDYDRIITGDLGYVGQEILIKLLNDKGYDISGIHMDCGIEIFDRDAQDTHSGGSGCGCSATTLAAYMLPQIEKGAWKRVLFVPTGAMLSPTSFNEGQSIPGIAHGVVIEHCS